MTTETAPIAALPPRPRITLIVPTYKEAENLPRLIDRVGRVRAENNLDLDLLIMDDDSRDGSVELIAGRGEDWVRIIVRTGQRGLSQSVLEGLMSTESDVLACMDADLSHPPEALPLMLQKLRAGADFVVGSRYVDGGTTADDWGVFRWLNSRVATLLARPLTHISDPMTGYFALPRSTLLAGSNFSPVGYKIALELIVRCGCERVVEVPIVFENRLFGDSKLTFRQQLLYLQHLRRLYIFKFGIWSQIAQFMFVGAMGTLVNLAVLTLMWKRVGIAAATAVAIVVAMTFNFVLNRSFSFSFARRGRWWPQYLRFVTASSIGALINFLITINLLKYVPYLKPQAAALGGVGAGLVFNFVASRYLVFRSKHVVPHRRR